VPISCCLPTNSLPSNCYRATVAMVTLLNPGCALSSIDKYLTIIWHYCNKLVMTLTFLDQISAIFISLFIIV